MNRTLYIIIGLLIILLLLIEVNILTVAISLAALCVIAAGKWMEAKNLYQKSQETETEVLQEELLD